MVHLYVLQNDEGRYYVGITSLLPKLRLVRHNNGDVLSTRKHRPWRVIYTEEYADFVAARKREKEVKSWHGGNAFRKFISSAARSSNGRTTDSESVYLSSTLSLAALLIKNKFGGVK